jgi:hypothetical protein
MKELEVLGRGTFWTVKLVEDPSTKTWITMKFFKEEFFGAAEWVGRVYE